MMFSSRRTALRVFFFRAHKGGPMPERNDILGSTTTTDENRMTREELETFLSEPHIARLATNRSDGYPHVTPVWQIWDGRVMSFVLGERRIHISNLRRDPRATIIVDEDWRPRTKQYAAGAAAVIMRGTVDVVDLKASVEPLQDIFVQHAVKFLDGAEGDTEYWATETGERYHFCQLTPVTTVSWDFRKFHGSHE